MTRASRLHLPVAILLGAHLFHCGGASPSPSGGTDTDGATQPSTSGGGSELGGGSTHPTPGSGAGTSTTERTDGGDAAEAGGTMRDAAPPVQTLPLPGSLSPKTTLSIPTTINTLGLAQDPYVIAGYLDVTHYGADPTGMKDSTAAIQAAIDDACATPSGTAGNTMVVFLPAGTYLVSSTLLAVQTYGLNNAKYGSISHYGGMLAPSLVGDPTSPPTIVLKDNSPGFNDPTNPVPIIHLVNTPNAGTTGCADQWVNATVGCFDVLFNAVVRDIHVTTGQNPGAIGVQFWSAQMSYMQNVSVNATGGFAGIEGAPATEVWTNISVVGGQYGLRLDWTAGADSIVGLQLSSQSVAGIYFEQAVGDLALTGFDIEETNAGATGIVMTNRIAQGTTLSLVDGILSTASTSQPSIDNQGDNSTYLENVYMQSGSGTLIANEGSTTVAANGDLQLVSEYSHVDLGTNNPGTSYVYALAGYTVLMDNSGTQTSKQQSDYGPMLGSGTPPNDLVRRHVPKMPWAFDTNVVWVTDYDADPTGFTDSTAAIQAAINLAHTKGSDEVFLPRGDYSLTGTLHLFANTKFFGIPGEYAQLLGFGWVTGGTPQPYLQVGDAVNQPAEATAGTAVVSDISFFMPVNAVQFPEYAKLLPNDGSAYSTTDQTYLYAVEWQTGSASVLNQIDVSFQYNTVTVPSPATRNYIQVDHSGGGRWYGLQIAGDWGPNGTNGHSVYVTGTTEPLTLYGSNPEHSNGIAFYGFDHASNIRVLGLKMESGSNTYLVEMTSSSNIMLSGFSGHGEFTIAESGSTNLNLNTAMYYTSPGSTLDFFVDLDNDASYSFLDAYALLKMGSFDETAFPTCATGLACP